MSSDFMVNFGNLIKRSRQKLGLTQAELGEKIGRPQSSIARLESGLLGDTHFGFIIELASALNIRAEDLVAQAMGRDNPPLSKKDIDKSKDLQRIKSRLKDTDPVTRKLVNDLFAELADWIKEAPKMPESKKTA